MEQESSPAKSQNLFQDNKVVNRQKIKYTWNKSRNFSPNIAYIGISKEDYYNKNFILDTYALVTRNLKPFSFDRKLADKTKHEMIYMLWRKCMPVEYYKYICEEKNFTYLNGKNVLQPTVLQIIIDFIEKDEKKNLRLLQNNLAQHKNIFPYVSSNFYPEIYCATEKRGFDLKSNFHILFKIYQDKTQMRWMGKNPIDYEMVRKETHVYKQKPVNTDDFSEEEEAKVKKRIEKQKKDDKS